MDMPSKTIRVPEGWQPPPPGAGGPVFLWLDLGNSDDRDVSLPIGFDEHGQALYAPRGITLNWGAA